MVPGCKYYYTIKAFKDGFWMSDPSQEVSVFTPVGMYGPVDQSQVQLNTSGQTGTPTGVSTPNIASVKRIISLNLGKTAYKVNDEIRQMDTAPVTREGRTMLPVRYVAEPLGANVAWDEASKKVTVALGDKVIELWIEKNKAMVNGREVCAREIPPIPSPETG